MQGGKGYLSVLVLVLGFLVASLGAQSSSTGIDRSQGFNEEGCVCHGPSGTDDGVANPGVRVLFELTPSPMRYEPGTTYNLTVGAAETDVPENPDGNKGGFNLMVSVGTLEAAEGWEDLVTHSSDQEFTHSSAGDRNGRTFNLTWTAPSSDEGAAVFTLFVNTVNGDGINNEADHWNGAVFVVPGPSGEVALGGEAETNPVDIGVRWFAHWVGLISLAAVVATLVLYYFVLKYGESIHTTDHRDRQGK